MNIIAGDRMYGLLTPKEKIEVRTLFREAKNPLMQIEIICDLYQVDLDVVCNALRISCDPSELKKSLRAIRYSENPSEYTKIITNWGSVRQFALDTGIREPSVRKALKRKNMSDSKVGKRILEELQKIGGDSPCPISQIAVVVGE